jgi:hypothetical protein
LDLRYQGGVNQVTLPARIGIEESASAEGGGWIHNFPVPLRIFAFSRIGLFVLVYISLILIPIREPGLWRSHPENLFLDGWSRWDSGWYVSIIEKSYTNKVNLGVSDLGQDTAFFPLYPLTVVLVEKLTGDVYLSGLIVSNVCFLLALIGLYRLISDRYDRDTAGRALLLLAFCPFSFFFSAMYTESLFLLSVVFAFYFCERRRYLLAGLFCGLAGATKVLGVLTLVGLFALYLEQIGFDWRKVNAGVAWLFLGILGPASYMFFLMMKFGDPLQFMRSQEAWGAVNPLEYIRAVLEALFLQFSRPELLVDLTHIMSFFAAVAVLLFTYRRLGFAYTLFSAAIVLGSFPRISGMGRYLIVVFTLFISMALLLKNSRAFVPILCVNCVLLALFSIRFSHWYWAG